MNAEHADIEMIQDKKPEGENLFVTNLRYLRPKDLARPSRILHRL